MNLHDQLRPKRVSTVYGLSQDCVPFGLINFITMPLGGETFTAIITIFPCFLVLLIRSINPIHNSSKQVDLQRIGFPAKWGDCA